MYLSAVFKYIFVLYSILYFIKYFYFSSLELGARVWAMRTNLLNVWMKGTVTNIKEGNNNEKLYKIRLDGQKYLPKPLPAKHLAYDIPASVILPVGTRIIGG